MKYRSCSIMLLIIYLFLICFDITKSSFELNDAPADFSVSGKMNSDTPFDYPQRSEQVYNLPWQWDSEFLKDQEAAGAYVLMAAYCTVLDNPLPGEEDNVYRAASLLKGIILMPGDDFSQNCVIGPYTDYNGYKKGPTYADNMLITTVGGGVCKIASALYNVCTLSNLRILERHAHGMPVPYVPYGQDATVSYGAKDFRFRNNTKFPILIWTKCINNRLYIGFYGQKLPPKVKWHHQILKVTKADIIQRKNAKLPPGTTKLLREGMNGISVNSWLTIETEDKTIIVKNLGIDNYKPMPYIYEVN